MDRRTDIWSLGVVLYEMLAGRLRFHQAGRALTGEEQCAMRAYEAAVRIERRHSWQHQRLAR